MKITSRTKLLAGVSIAMVLSFLLGIRLGKIFQSMEYSAAAPWDLRKYDDRFPDACARLKDSGTFFAVDSLASQKVIRIVSRDEQTGRLNLSILDSAHRHYQWNFDSCPP